MAQQPSSPSERQSERAAMRDASFYASQQHNTARGGEPYIPRYHVVSENGDGPACNPDGMLLVVHDEFNGTDVTINAEEAPEAMRCRRGACARRWPNGGAS